MPNLASAGLWMTPYSVKVKIFEGSQAPPFHKYLPSVRCSIIKQMSICPLQMPMWPSVCVILLAMTCGVESIWHDHHQRLVSHLFTNYSKHVRPSEDGLPTNVDIRMEPQKLVFLDEETEALHMKFVLMLRWTDARLRWDPEDFDNISKIFYPQS